MSDFPGGAPRSTSPPARGQRSWTAFDLLFPVVSIMLLFLVVRPAPSRSRFQYDEADFMTAARAGLAENYFERSSASFPTFLRRGIRAVRERTSRAELSEYIRSRGDVSFYRHYHGPLYVDWLIVGGRFAQSESEQRLAGLTFHLLNFATLWFGMLWLFGLPVRAAAVVASSAHLFNGTAIASSLGLSAHPLYAWLALIALLAIARFTQRADRRHWLLAVAAATVALCALEFGALLFLVLGICAWLVRKELARSAGGLRALLIPGAATFAGVLAVIWPAGLFKLSLLTPYVNLAYLALVRKGSFGATGLAELWVTRFSTSPVEWALLVLGLVAAVLVLLSRRYRAHQALLPFPLYAIPILLLTVKSGSDRYLLSALGPAYLLGSIVLSDCLRNRPSWTRIGLVALLYGFLLLGGVRAVPRKAAPARSAPPDLVDVLSQDSPPIRSVLLPADYLPTVHYYLPGLSLKSYLPHEEKAVVDRLLAHEIDAAVVSDSTRGIAQQLRGDSRLVQRTASNRELLAVYLWSEQRLPK